MQISKDWEKEEDTMRLLQPGQFDFSVASAESGTSQAGNDMIVVQLHVFDGDGGKVFVRDWLTEAYKKKVVQFLRCVGLDDLVDNSGELTAVQCVNRTGVCQITVEDYQDKNGVMRKTNRVDRYEQAVKPPGGDDIPF